MRVALKVAKHRHDVREKWTRSGKPVLIWSGEHQCWWRDNGNGYTKDVNEAGVYFFEDAYRRTSHCGNEKRIEYVTFKTEMQPVRIVEENAPRKPKPATTTNGV